MSKRAVVGAWKIERGEGRKVFREDRSISLGGGRGKGSDLGLLDKVCS